MNSYTSGYGASYGGSPGYGGGQSYGGGGKAFSSRTILLFFSGCSGADYFPSIVDFLISPGYGGSSYGGGGVAGGYGGASGGGYGSSNLGAGLGQIDFAHTQLEKFEKDFYIEHPDVASRSEQEAAEWRASKQIVVEGTDVPKPVFTFDEASMPEYILTEVLKCGFDKPTPIQSQGWPMALKGRNMVGVSATGSGTYFG